MGTSFVTADGEHGFWMRDRILELFLRLLALHLDEVPEAKPEAYQELLKIRNQWLLASTGFFSGCVPSDVQSAVATEEGKALVLAAIDSLRKSLTLAPEVLDYRLLNLFGFDRSSSRWTAGFETARLIAVTDAFLDLVNGRITDTVATNTHMPGSRY